MKRTMLVTIIMVLLGCLFAEADPAVLKAFSSADAPLTVGDILEQVYSRLSRLEKTAIPMLDTDTADEVSQTMTEIQALLVMIPKETRIGGAKPGQITTDSKPENPVSADNPRLKPRLTPVPDRYPISDADFARLNSSLEREPFRKGKLAIMQLSAEHNRFSVEQIVRLINEHLVFSTDKLTALNSLYPACLDPEKNYLIIESLPTIDAKAKATEIMREN